MSTVKSLTEEETLKYVLDSLHRNSIDGTYPQLKSNFPDYEPEILFRSLVFQQCWVDICSNKFSNAIAHVQELGESPGQIFYQMWRQTTRNKARQILYEYLHKQSLLSQTDEDNYFILLKLINSKKPETAETNKPKSFFSFIQKSKSESQPKSDEISQSQLDIMKAFTETLKKLTEDDTTHEFEANSPLNDSYDETKSMIFPDLFKKLLPKENLSNSFIGNIILIESQPPKILKYLKTNEGSTVERLWLLHCEQKITEMQQLFKDDITKFKTENFESKPKKLLQFQHQHQSNQPTKKQKKLKCLQFCNLYYKQMNEYEKESLFDILAVNGYFVDSEINDAEKLLYRICKNKLLFDSNWWNKTTTLNFELFFKNFSKFCSVNNLYLPFEIFVINNPKTKDIDISNDPSLEEHPLIRFIWDLWVKRETFSASISNFQFLSNLNKNEKNYEELWKDVPEDSLAPLSLFVWNKDPRKFLPNSPESLLLADKLKKKFPLLSALVKGETPHPQCDVKYEVSPDDKKWRFSIYTSKCDLELHNIIESHFEQYDFSKIFTNYYGEMNFNGQPPYPHFDHPELISKPSDPPYIYYVKSMLPISAFQTAVSDNVSEEQFKELCLNCMRESLMNKSIRLAALTFIELTDFKFKTDFAIDFKLCIAIFDLLTKVNDSNNSNGFHLSSLFSAESVEHISLSGSSISTLIGNEANNSSAFIELIQSELSKVFESKSEESAKFLQHKLHPTDSEVLLLSLLLGIRCHLPPDYEVIDLLATKMHPAELVLFLDRAEEIGCKYDMNEVANVVREKMPENSLKETILFILTQQLPSIYENKQSNEEEEIDMEMEPALVVFNCLNRKSDTPYISLLEEALIRRDSFYSIIANMVEGSDPSLCALVTLVTMTDAFSFDVCHPPDKQQRSRLFLEVICQLLFDGKSDDVLKSIELFSKKSIILPIVSFYDSVFIFAFKKAQLSIIRFYELIKKCQENVVNDDLLGEINVDDIMNSLFPLQEELAKHCASKSQVHLFRYLQLLKETDNFESDNLISPFLRQRVKLAGIIQKYDDFRLSLTKCNLIGDKDKIVSDLLTYHSLSLGREAAECFGIQSSQVIKKWLLSQYSSATTIDDVLKAHSRVVEILKHPATLHENTNEYDTEYNEEEEEKIEVSFLDPNFFICLFAALIQYVKPSSIVHILEFAEKMYSSNNDDEIKGKNEFLKNLKSLILHLKICALHSIESTTLLATSNTIENNSIEAIIKILFPLKDGDNDYNNFVKTIPTEISLNLKSLTVIHSIDSIHNFFNTSIEKSIEICLTEKGLDEAYMLCDWQNRKPPEITVIETIKMLFIVFNSNRSKVVHIIDDDDEDQAPLQCFSSKQREMIIENGLKSANFKEKTFDSFFIVSIEAKELQVFLDSVAAKMNPIFKTISLQFKATAALLAYSDSDTEYKKKAADLIKAKLLLGEAARERNIEFLRSPLPIMVDQISLTKSLIESESFSDEQVSDMLSNNFIQTVTNLKKKENSNIGFILVDDYGDKFIDFVNLCKDPTLIGDKLLLYVTSQINTEKVLNQKRIIILSNILLHASLCTTRIEECAKLLDSMYEKVFVEKGKINQNSEIYQSLIKIITKFPEPSLLPRFITFIVTMNENNIDSIPKEEISSKLGLEILNEARQLQSFKPDNFFNITLACKLYHEHAILQVECANSLLEKIIKDRSDAESDIESSSENLIDGLSSSENDLIPLDRREQRKLKKLEKQKQKEEKLELKKMKKDKEKKKEIENQKLNKQEILQESSRHFLLALAYSLHEKCYNLSIECLKKLSLISLQQELSNSNSNSMTNSSSNLIEKSLNMNLNVFGLNENDVLTLMMTREFPFALTIAISYDMDNEVNWSKSLFAQSIQKQGDDFLAAFMYFKPITANLWNGIVERYREYFDQKEKRDPTLDKDVKERMKTFVMKVPNLVERYRILKKLNFESLVENMQEKYPVVCEWCDKVI